MGWEWSRRKGKNNAEIKKQIRAIFCSPHFKWDMSETHNNIFTIRIGTARNMHVVLYIKCRMSNFKKQPVEIAIYDKWKIYAIDATLQDGYFLVGRLFDVRSFTIESGGVLVQIRSTNRHTLFYFKRTYARIHRGKHSIWKKIWWAQKLVKYF